MMNYHVLEMIGEGSFGRVYKGRKRFSGQVVALKFIPKTGRSEKDLKSLRREIDIMRGLRHPNIVQMLDSLETDNEVVVVTEFAEGELFQILEDDGNLPEEQVREIACQLVSALYYLHSHRILHRDMKPQNILLGKGGVLKLCDFGFARAMSLQTLVLTSIKGTPLYMSPELVEEKPYDHTSDLWSLGCILYELYVGTPPFYTNSIFQLVSIIIKDPVKWPKGISPHFKCFLQGLLTKDPRQRLSWPALLYHPFVADRINVVDDSRDCGIEKPFTIQASPETQALKEQQAKELAPRSGHSKILRKAREKMLEESKQKHSAQPGLPAGQAHADPTGEPRPKQPLSTPERAARPSQEAGADGSPGASSAAEREKDQCQPPTPGLHHITQDYEQEFPEVQVGPRLLRRRRRRSHNMENVDLDNEEMDSDEEWQQLIEVTDPSALQLSTPLTLLRDQSFQQRVQARLGDSSTQVLEGMLEGATRLRPALRVIRNLLATRCDWDLLHTFCQRLQLPQFLLTLLGQTLHSERIRQQPWCGRILSDLLAVLAVYFSSDFDAESSGTSCGLQVFEQSAQQFVQLLETLLSPATEREITLREQSMMCLIFICGTMDRSPSSICCTFYSQLLSSHQRILAILVEGTFTDPPALRALEGPRRDQWEQLTATHTAALAAVCTTTPGAISCRDAKQQIARYLNDSLLSAQSTPRRATFIKGIQQPPLSLNTLKVLYSCCQLSESNCQLLVDEALDSLLQLLHCKLAVEDVVLSMTQEVTLYLLTVLLIQSDRVPESLEHSIEVITSIFHQPSAPTLTCAAAFLMIRLCSRGTLVEIQGEDFLQSIQTALQSCPQPTVSPPMDQGMLDGLFTLLLQYVNEGEPSMLRDFADSELWNTAWYCLARVLRLSPDRPIMEGETPRPGQPSPAPDWSLLSPSGIVTFLGLATVVFSAVPSQCLPILASPHSVTPLILHQLLSDTFLHHLDHRLQLLPAVGLAACSDEAVLEIPQDVVLRVCQLLCFPFAMDVDEPMFSEILRTLLEGDFTHHLVQLSLGQRLPGVQREMPLALLCRLGFSDRGFVDQLVGSGSVGPEPWARYLGELLLLLEPDSEPEPGTVSRAELLLSLLGQVCRCSAHHLPYVRAVVSPAGDWGTLRLALCHPDPGLRRKACSLTAWLLSEQGAPPVPLLEAVLPLLGDPEPGVRESAGLAVGNAAFGGSCVTAGALPALLHLLSDPSPRTRRHACSALHNLGTSHCSSSSSGQALGQLLLSSAVPQRLLQLAAPQRPHSQPAPVREAALSALRALAQWPHIREVLISMNSCEKLSLIVQETEQCVLVSARNTDRSVLHHCHRLLETLSTSPSE